MLELKRVIGSLKMALLLATLVAVCIFFQFTNNTYPKGIGKVYKSEIKKYQQMELQTAIGCMEEELDKLNEMALQGFSSEIEWNTFYLNQSVMRELLTQFQHLKYYPEYLDTIEKNVEQMQTMKLFNQEGSFTLRNILKTGEDFPDSSEVSLKLTETLAIEKFLQDKTGNYLVLIWLLAVVLKITEERKKGLWSLIHGSRNGRVVLGIKRILILFVSAIIGVVTILGAELMTDIFLYGGLGDLSVSVQSSSMFQYFPEIMSFGQFLTLYFALKILGTWLIGTLILMLFLAINNFKLAIAITSVILVVEFGLFTFIPDSYTIVFLRYVNLFAFVDIAPIFLRYLNIDFFGFPIRGSSLTIFLLPVMLIFSSVSLLWVSYNKKPYTDAAWLIRILDNARTPISKCVAKLHLGGQELRKVLWTQKGIFVFGLLGIWLVNFAEVPPADINLYNTKTAGYAGKFTGKITEDTLVQINNEIEKISKWDENEQTINALDALEVLKAETIEKFESDKELWLLNPAGYMAIFNRNFNNYQREYSLICIFFVVMLTGGIFSYEKQQNMDKLLCSTARGRAVLWKNKIVTAFGVTTVVWMLMSLRELQLVVENYEMLQGWNAPIQSLEIFSKFPLDITIGIGVLGFYLLRLIALYTVTSITCVLSSKCKTVNSTLLLCVVVLVLPVCLEIMGISGIEKITLARLFSPLECKVYVYVIATFISVLAVINCKKLTCRKN